MNRRRSALEDFCAAEITHGRRDLKSGVTSRHTRPTAGSDGARVMPHAGERQNVPIVAHGPFVAESRADRMRLSEAYVRGHASGQ